MKVTDDDLADLREAGRRLTHRGPDGQDVDRWGSVGIAFRRLAVYDVAGGRQPLWNEDETVGLVVNGTIYNHEALRARLERDHRFRTRSDCEPLVHLYEDEGRAMVSRLLGMFAFAIWDLRRDRVLLGRDRLGLKPLFYAADRERLVFGSEIKALFAFAGCPREVAWPEVLADPTVNNAVALEPQRLASGFRGIEQLPGGTVLEIDLRRGEVRERRYWDLPEPDPTLDAETAARRYEETLRDAIDVCLTGEAGIGLTLSGGVDSALIAGRAAQVAPVPTFTALAESTRANGDAAGALAIAEDLGLPHAQTHCDTDALLSSPERWKDLLWRCETPLCGPEQLMKAELFKAGRQVVPDLKVMLSGLGGDEFAGGYSPTLAAGRGAGWEAFVATLARLWQRGRRRSDPVLGIWDEHVAPGLLRGGATEPDLYARFLAHKQRDLLMYNLWCEDRLASAQSIEARAPHLDHRLVELLASIPAAARPGLLWDKRMLRGAGRGLLAEQHLRRPKVPFFHGAGEATVYAPFVRMLAADGYALAEEALGSGPGRELVDLDVLIGVLDRAAGPGGATPARVEMLLRVVNLGLLDDMARHGREVAAEPAPSLWAIDDWHDDAQVAPARAAASAPAADLAGAVPRYAAGALLVASHGDDPRHFLTAGGRVRFEVLPEDPWLRVLQGIDGEATFEDLCAAAGVDFDAVRSHAETVVRHAIVQLADAPRPAPAAYGSAA